MLAASLRCRQVTRRDPETATRDLGSDIGTLRPLSGLPQNSDRPTDRASGSYQSVNSDPIQRV